MPSAMIVKTKVLTTSFSNVSVIKGAIFLSELHRYDRYRDEDEGEETSAFNPISQCRIVGKWKA
jgi:hypothetical protein